jgi:hypothetical protein
MSRGPGRIMRAALAEGGQLRCVGILRCRVKAARIALEEIDVATDIRAAAIALLGELAAESAEDARVSRSVMVPRLGQQQESLTLADMGRASQRKKLAQAQRRERPNLIRKVREQVELLRVLGAAFDGGQRIVAYPLATTIRVLVHDTARSHALLAQLGEFSAMPLLDTSALINPANEIKAHGGLVLLKMTSGVGLEWAPRIEVPGPTPGTEPRDVPFRLWWEKDITRDGGAAIWSRRRMVLDAANKEGARTSTLSNPWISAPSRKRTRWAGPTSTR